MTTHAIVVMLYVQLAIFVLGIGSLLVQRWWRHGRVSDAANAVPAEKRDLVLSRLGA